MIHLRIVTPAGKAERALELLEGSHSVCNVDPPEGAARRPEGDVILADVAREDASVIISRPQGARHPRRTARSRSSRSTPRSPSRPSGRSSTRGARPADAVVWEEVEAHTSENVELSGVFLAFMVIAGAARRGRHLPGLADPDRRRDGRRARVRPARRPLRRARPAPRQARRCARRSPLAVGFPLAIAVVYLAVLAFKATGLFPETFSEDDHSLANIISAARLLRLLRRRVRRRGRDAEPQHGEVRAR